MHCFGSDFDGDEIVFVEDSAAPANAELELVTPSALCMQPHSPNMAIYPIQDTVLAMYTMTCTVPPEKPFHLPAADLPTLLMNVTETPFDKRPEMHALIDTMLRIKKTWAWFAAKYPTHPTVQTLKQYDIPFECTGAGIISCLLPETVEYLSPDCCTDAFQTKIRPGRQLPLWVTRGIIVQGIVTNRHVGSNATGLLAHIAQYHGKKTAMNFTDQMQVLASFVTTKSTATFSLYDCMLPQVLARSVKQDMDDQLHQAAIMRTSGSNCVTAGACRQQALNHLMRAKERSEWIVSRYVRTPFHYTEYLEKVVLAEQSQRDKPNEDTTDSLDELLGRLVRQSFDRRNADPSFDHFSARNQAGLMLESHGIAPKNFFVLHILFGAIPHAKAPFPEFLKCTNHWGNVLSVKPGISRKTCLAAHKRYIAALIWLHA